MTLRDEKGLFFLIGVLLGSSVSDILLVFYYYRFIQ